MQCNILNTKLLKHKIKRLLGKTLLIGSPEKKPVNILTGSTSWKKNWSAETPSEKLQTKFLLIESGLIGECT